MIFYIPFCLIGLYNATNDIGSFNQHQVLQSLQFNSGQDSFNKIKLKPQITNNVNKQLPGAVTSTNPKTPSPNTHVCIIKYEKYLKISIYVNDFNSFFRA